MLAVVVVSLIALVGQGRDGGPAVDAAGRSGTWRAAPDGDVLDDHVDHVLHHDDEHHHHDRTAAPRGPGPAARSACARPGRGGPATRGAGARVRRLGQRHHRRDEWGDRAANGLGALCGNGQLAGFAEDWASWMAQNGSLTHQDLNRILAATTFNTIAENILDGAASLTPGQMESAWTHRRPTGRTSSTAPTGGRRSASPTALTAASGRGGFGGLLDRASRMTVHTTSGMFANRGDAQRRLSLGAFRWSPGMSAVTIDVPENEVTGLIGPNGAGKTTLFNVITGLQPPTGGTVVLDGRDITNVKPHRRARLGIGRTFQRLETFGTLSVRDNVLVAAEMRRGCRAGNWVLRLAKRLLGRHVAPDFKPGDLTDELIERLGLTSVATDASTVSPPARSGWSRWPWALATKLTGRAARRAVPRRASTRRRLTELSELLIELAATGLAILLVEHDMGLVMSSCHHIDVLYFGQIIAFGTPTEVQENPLVRAAYLGEGDEAAGGAGGAAGPAGGGVGAADRGARWSPTRPTAPRRSRPSPSPSRRRRRGRPRPERPSSSST